LVKAIENVLQRPAEDRSTFLLRHLYDRIVRSFSARCNNESIEITTPLEALDLPRQHGLVEQGLEHLTGESG
jgi:hypothetical protein